MTSGRLARAAGIFYFGIFFPGIFAEIFVRGKLLAHGDAARTASNILSHEFLFRAGILADLAGVVSFFLSALALHALLRKSGETAANLFLLLVVISNAITSLNLLNPFAALFLLQGEYMHAFREDQVQALALALFELHKYGYLLAQVFFGAWLFPLGYLVRKKRMVPGFLGFILILAGAGHLAEVIVEFLFPRQTPILSPIALTAAALGELPFFLWLLFKGCRPPFQPHADLQPVSDNRPVADNRLVADSQPVADSQLAADPRSSASARPAPWEPALTALPIPERWAIAGLLALSLVPVCAGLFRIGQLSFGAAITPENARFFAAPLPIVLHIVASSVYCILGAFQFSAAFRAKRPGWHRAAGRILIPAGLLSALSGIILTLTYPPVDFDGPLLFAIRLAVGAAMASFLVAGTQAIRRRDFPRHRAWMMRAYALGMGAGTQFLTHLPLAVFPGLMGEGMRAFCMGAGWAINLAVAEWLLRKSGFVLSRPGYIPGRGNGVEKASNAAGAD